MGFPTQILAFVVVDLAYLLLSATVFSRHNESDHCGEKNSRVFHPKRRFCQAEPTC